MTLPYKTPSELGYLVGITERGLSRLALLACDMGAKRKASPEDAMSMLIDFDAARRKANGSPKKGAPPHKVQVSKLGKFIALGNMFGEEGCSLIETAMDMHINEFTKEKYTGALRYTGEYNLLIEVAREALAREKLLSRKDIISLMTLV
jgi:hypothetical protein